ncbi:hypothetical protein C7374_102178 [Falsochrobactrum ovis]|uniref:Uncharacterized protein n=1 Tax=Falsochrobactrum ovis TaxID=1293442 RepID=A0A364JY08_9HYPH|nr:hypothetical protein C7374_102178 [Falsochrobactrum ovis]
MLIVAGRKNIDILIFCPLFLFNIERVFIIVIFCN